MTKELKRAKKIIIDHLNNALTVKKTKWVFNETKKVYEEVDAGFTEEELKTMQYYHSENMQDHCKLKELLEDLI